MTKHRKIWLVDRLADPSLSYSSSPQRFTANQIAKVLQTGPHNFLLDCEVRPPLAGPTSWSHMM